MKRISFTLLLSAYIFSAFGQKHKEVKGYDRTKILKTVDSVAYNKFKHSYPILRDTTGTYPKTITATGKIVAITTGISCGVFCGCGTIEIKLTEKIKDYDSLNVFVAVPCFNVIPKDYIDKTITIKLSLLLENNNDCFWNELPMNSIDSKGVPFYIPEDLDDKLFSK